MQGSHDPHNRQTRSPLSSISLITHPPEKEKPNVSGSGDQKKKGWSCAGKQVKEWREAAKQCNHAHMAEFTMVVNPPAPIASLSAPLPAPPALLPVIMTINSNSRIIPAPAFILKVILAAIAATPIPCRYTGSTGTRPSIWVNAKKARNLADHMDITSTISMLKHLETANGLCWGLWYRILHVSP